MSAETVDRINFLNIRLFKGVGMYNFQFPESKAFIGNAILLLVYKDKVDYRDWYNINYLVRSISWLMGCTGSLAD